MSNHKDERTLEQIVEQARAAFDLMVSTCHLLKERGCEVTIVRGGMGANVIDRGMVDLSLKITKEF